MGEAGNGGGMEAAEGLEAMTTELLPCSKCRRVPEWHTKFFRRGQRGEAAWPMIICPECKPHGHSMGVAEPTRDACVSAWNRLHGSPLTLAERPQDVPACDDRPPPFTPYVSKPLAEFERVIGGLRFRADPSMSLGTMAIADTDEPSVGDGVRVVPSAASCVERGRSCVQSVGACSGGVR